MSRVLKVLGVVLCLAGMVVLAVFAYRRSGLLVGSLVVLAALLVVALAARREAAREEKAGMADWRDATADDEAAREEFFGDWTATGPAAAPVRPNSVSHEEAELLASLSELGSPPKADPRPVEAAAAATPAPAEDVPAAATSTPDAPDEGTEDDEPASAAAAPVSAPVATTEPGPDPEPAPTNGHGSDHDLVVAASRRSVIDWNGTGGSIEDHVRTNDDILAASEVTALPEPIAATAGAGAGPAAGGSELARLLAKVESRLRDYE